MTRDKHDAVDEDDEGLRTATLLEAAGYKILVGPAGDEPQKPRSWREVPRRVNDALIGIAVGIFDLAEAVLTSTTRLVRGIGNLPSSVGMALTARATRQVDQADAAEAERQHKRLEVSPDVAAERLRRFLARKKVNGLSVKVTTFEGVSVITIAPPAAEEVLPEVIEAAVRALPPTDRE